MTTPSQGLVCKKCGKVVKEFAHIKQGVTVIPKGSRAKRPEAERIQKWMMI